MYFRNWHEVHTFLRIRQKLSLTIFIAGLCVSSGINVICQTVFDKFSNGKMLIEYFSYPCSDGSRTCRLLRTDITLKF